MTRDAYYAVEVFFTVILTIVAIAVPVIVMSEEMSLEVGKKKRRPRVLICCFLLILLALFWPPWVVHGLVELWRWNWDLIYGP